MTRIKLEVQTFGHRKSREQRVRQRIPIDDVFRRTCIESEEPDAALDRHLFRTVAKTQTLTVPEMIRERTKWRVEEHVRYLVIMAALILDAILQPPRPCSVWIIRARFDRRERRDDVVSDERRCQRNRNLAAPNRPRHEQRGHEKGHREKTTAHEISAH